MATPRRGTSHHRSPDSGLPLALIGIAWVVVLLFLVSSRGFRDGLVAALLVLAALGVSLAVIRWIERRRWSWPLHHLVMQLVAAALE